MADLGEVGELGWRIIQEINKTNNNFQQWFDNIFEHYYLDDLKIKDDRINFN